MGSSHSCFRLVPLLLLALLAGCGPSHEEMLIQRAVGAYYGGDYLGAQGQLRELAQKTNSDFALNNCRLGSAALGDYNLDEAEAAFFAGPRGDGQRRGKQRGTHAGGDASG